MPKQMYPVKNNKTGKTYDMPWDKDEPPTKWDAMQFIDSQENPTWKDRAKQAWDTLNTPLADVSPQTRQMMEENKKYNPITGTIGEGAVNMMTGMSSPLSLGLMATSVASPVARAAGFGRTAKALAVPGEVAGAGAVGHGAYRMVTEPEVSGKLGGAFEAGLGGLGWMGSRGQRMSIEPPPPMPGPGAPSNTPPGARPRPGMPNIPPFKITPEMQLKMDEMRAAAEAFQGRNKVQPYRNPNLGTNKPGIIDADFHVAEEPLGQGQITAPPSRSPAALPPGRRTFFGGLRSVSDNLGDIGDNGLTPQENNAIQDLPDRFRSAVSPGARELAGLPGEGYPNQPVREMLENKDLHAKRTKPRRTDQIGRGPLNVNRIDTSLEPPASTEPVHTAAPAETPPPNRPYSKMNDGDVEFFAKNGDKAAIAEAKLRPSLADRIKHLFKSEVGAVGDVEGVEKKTAELKDKFNVSPDEQFEAARNDPREVRPGATVTQPIDKEAAQANSSRSPVRAALDRLKNDESGVIRFGKEDPIGAENHKRAKDWATRRESSKIHGQFAKEEFEDLRAGGEDLIDRYQAGDRSGRLADVEKLMNELYDNEVKAGVFKDSGARKENYLRQLYQPELVDEEGAPAVRGGVVPKTPGFAKRSDYATYAQARAAGKTAKFNNLADLIGERVRESKLAIANKEFDTYLTRTLQKDPTMTIKEPAQLRFQGPFSRQLGDYTHNVLASGERKLGQVAAGVSKTKNIYLAGGIPGTPLNIHGWNIARSRYMASGIKGLKDFAAGVFKPSEDISYLKSERPLIKKAIDYGYQFSSEHEGEDALHQALQKSKIGRGVNKVLNLEEKLFEDPLFKVKLPAEKARVLRENYDRLLKAGKTEEQALRGASTIANDFMGGINKSLRNKTYKDMLQIGVLAPDWAESRINLAVKGVKSLLGKEDPIYGKALARGGIMRTAGGAAQLAFGDRRGEKPADLTSIGLGRTDSGRYREFPIYGTAVEGLRLPEEAIRGAVSGDLSPVVRILRNRTSQPAQSLLNTFYSGTDAFGNPLSGKDKYGRKIPMATAGANYLNELSAPFQPQQLQALVNFGRGKQGGEEALSQAFELPLRYSTPPPVRSRRTRSRGRR